MMPFLYFSLMILFPIAFSLNIWSFDPKEASLWSHNIIDNGSAHREKYFLAMSGTELDNVNACSALERYNYPEKDFVAGYYFLLLSDFYNCQQLLLPANLPAFHIKELSLVESSAAVLLYGRMNLPLDDLDKWAEKSTGYILSRKDFYDESSFELALIIRALIHYQEKSLVASLREAIFNARSAIIEAHPNLLTYLIAVYSDSSDLSPAILTAAVDSLHFLKLSSDPQVMFESIESLKAISSLLTSVQYELLPHKFMAGEGVVLTLRAFDICGKSVQVKSGTLISLRKAGKDGVVVENIEFEGSSVTLQGLSLQPGRYFAVIHAISHNSPSAAKYQAAFLVHDAALVKSVRWSVSASSQAESAEWETVSSSNPSQISANIGDHLHVAVSLQPTITRRYHQLQLKFCSVSEFSCVLVTPISCKESDEITCLFRIRVGDQAEKSGFHSGEFSAAVIIGDVSLSEAVEMEVVNLLVNFPDIPVSPHPLYRKALLHDSDSTLSVLPEIIHQMRPPAKRAPNVVSYGFCGLIVVPLLVFFYSILSLKPQMQLFPSLSSLISTLIFSGLLLVYGLYWLGFEGMSFYTTIKYLCFLFPMLMATARHTILSLTKQRLESDGCN